MGWERDYQALPDGCELLERAKSDSDFGQYLCFVKQRFKHGGDAPYSISDQAHIDFCREVKKLIGLYPGIEKRNYALDQYFDMVHYLISPWKRGETNSDPNDLGTRAICGATALPGHLVGPQGFSVRYSGPDDVLEIALTLESLTTEDLRIHYNPFRMERCCYKFWADRADEQTWQWICEYFEGLKAFYMDVAECEQGVVALQD